MMHDTLPDWLAVPLIVIASLGALYRCYIAPGYARDREERHARDISRIEDIEPRAVVLRYQVNLNEMS